MFLPLANLYRLYQFAAAFWRYQETLPPPAIPGATARRSITFRFVGWMASTISQLVTLDATDTKATTTQ